MNSKRLLLLVVSLLLLLMVFSCKEKSTEPDVQQTVSTPTFNPPEGSYDSAQNVSISCSTSGAIIRYTTNSSEPTSSSTVYSSPISVSSTTTIKAKGFKDGSIPSAMASATFTITIPTPGQMALVPGFTFAMGRSYYVFDEHNEFGDELPEHNVTLNPFYFGKHEVTQAEYAQYLQPAIDWSIYYGLGDDYPAYNVSWYDILKYCNLRSLAEGLTPVYSISGSTNPADWGEVPSSSNSTWDAAICNWNANGYRLPTEAEWEHAARSAISDPDLYSGSDNVSAVAWYEDNSGGITHPVCTKAPNYLGLHDMSGNVLEYCWDWYSSSYYSSSPSNNPTGPESGLSRVVRGGSWNLFAADCRTVRRRSTYQYSRASSFGFRVVRSSL